MTRTATVLRAAAMLAFAVILPACNGPSVVTNSASTASGDPIAMSASNYSVGQSAGSVSVTVTRTGAATAAVSVDYSTSDGTAVAGSDYTAVSGTLNWAENDSTPKTISVPVSNATPYSGNKTFTVALTDPSAAASIGSPGSALVTISGAANTSAGTVQLSDSVYAIAQNAGTLTVTVNRANGASGAVSVAYATNNGTAKAGADYTATSGILQWADADAASKTFTVAISDAAPFFGKKVFALVLSDPRSGVALGSPDSATVTITGDASGAAGSVRLSASSYAVAQSAGTLQVTVDRTGGSSGAISVAYDTVNGTAVAGVDFTAATGTLQWADGDATARTFSIAISKAPAFSGSKTFRVVLSNPSGTTISNPGSATVTLSGAGAPAAGSLELSAPSYAVGQSAGSVMVTVRRTGGSTGAASVGYDTASKTAIEGVDFTATSGTLQWADGDAASKTFSVAISNATPFSGNKSFAVGLSSPTGGTTLGSPSNATVTIAGDAAGAVGALQLSASSYTVAQSAGSLTVTVNRTGGSTGAISVAYDTVNGTAVAGADFTAASGTLQWADGDQGAKTFSIDISNATPFSGSRSFTVALSNPGGGAALSSPSSAVVSINGSVTNSGSTFWIYHNGVMAWAGDYSWAAPKIDYQDTTGVPLSGAFDIAVYTNPFGGWQPYSCNGAGDPAPQCTAKYSFDTKGYTKLTFALKPKVANQVWATMFHSPGDIAIGQPVIVNNYGPAPVVGQWATYTIPLADVGVLNAKVYKFFIQDKSGLANNTFYVDNVGFTN